tara:strand:- start:2349 stop:3536 length:1188 start_codon:yes stop_codon:yes gene_type:complete
MEQLQLDLNNLSYDPDTDVSVAIQRQLQSRYADKSSYASGEQMNIKLSGRQFIDAKNSSLYFRFKNTADFQFGAEVGSSLNLFSRVRILAPDGSCISDLLHANAYSAISQKLYQSKPYTDAIGGVYGLGENIATGAGIYTYSVPLRMISPFFDTDKLLPPQLTDGMTIEIYLESKEQALLGAGDYSLDGVEVVLDTIRVADGVLNNIMSRPMTYEFTDVVQNASTMSAAVGQIYYEVPRSLTNATSAIALLRVSTNQDNTATSGFLFIGPKVDLETVTANDEMEWRVGSTLLPQQRAVDGIKIYNAMLNARGVIANGTPEFNAPRSTLFETTYGVYMCDLNRSRLYNNSGRELSNGQRLSIYIKQSVAANYIVDVFVKFVCRVVMKENGRFEVEQ